MSESRILDHVTTISSGLERLLPVFVLNSNTGA